MYHIPVNPDLSENVHYNIPDFPAYLRRGRLSWHPNYRAISHWHTDLEFIVVLSGTMDYNINGEILTLTAGQGLMVNSRRFHFGFSDQKIDCEFLCILLHPDLLSGSAGFQKRCLEPILGRRSIPYQVFRPEVPWERQIIEGLLAMERLWMCEDAPFLILAQFAALMGILSQHIQPEQRPPVCETELDSVNAMVAFIQQHYHEPISLKEIAAAGNCCRTYCASRFQAYLGNPPGKYLCLFRLERGAELLRKTEDPVTEIAYRCGFSSSSYFCECFRHQYGVSPKSFRQKTSASGSDWPQKP